MRSIRNAVEKLKVYLAEKEAQVLYNPRFRKNGSAIIGEVIVIVIVLIIAVVYKTGATDYISQMWESIITHSHSLWG